MQQVKSFYAEAIVIDFQCYVEKFEYWRKTVLLFDKC